jgi:hypothetical protein
LAAELQHYQRLPLHHSNLRGGGKGKGGARGQRCDVGGANNRVGCRVGGVGCGARGAGFRVLCLEVTVLDLGCGMRGAGCRV